MTKTGCIDTNYKWAYEIVLVFLKNEREEKRKGGKKTRRTAKRIIKAARFSGSVFSTGIASFTRSTCIP